MGWQSIANYTQRSVGRIDQATEEKAASRTEGINTILQGVSLLDKFRSGQKELSALKEYGEQEGLTYNKKTKSFFGTKKARGQQVDDEGFSMTDQHPDYDPDWDEGKDQSYQISSGDLRNIRDLTAYGDQTFEGMITGKGGKIKGAYAYNQPEVSVPSKVATTTTPQKVEPSISAGVAGEQARSEYEADQLRLRDEEMEADQSAMMGGEYGTQDELEALGSMDKFKISSKRVGKDLWSKFKGHVSEGMEETGGEFAFENFGDVGKWGAGVAGSALDKIKGMFKKKDEFNILDIVKQNMPKPPFENTSGTANFEPLQTEDWSTTAFQIEGSSRKNNYDYGLFNTEEDKRTLVGGTEFKSSSDKYVHWPWDD